MRDLTLIGDCPACRRLRSMPLANVPAKLRRRPLGRVAALFACDGCGAAPINVELAWNAEREAWRPAIQRRLTLVSVERTRSVMQVTGRAEDR